MDFLKEKFEPEFKVYVVPELFTFSSTSGFEMAFPPPLRKHVDFSVVLG